MVAGSVLSCYPYRRLSTRRQAFNYVLNAANDSDICKFEIMRLCLRLEEFSWNIIKADVSTAIIKADFLVHYHLLPDCTSKRLVDGNTGLYCYRSSSCHRTS